MNRTIILQRIRPPKIASITPGTRFSILFLLFCAGFFLLLELTPDQFYYPVNRLNAILAGHLLHLLGMTPKVHGLIITLNGFRAQVIGECSAVFLAVLPLAFIFAYPSNLKNKAMGWLCGLSLLFCVNLIRIAVLVYTGSYIPEHFEIVHLYLGQTFMVLVVLGICLGWTQWTGDNKEVKGLKIIMGRCLIVSLVGFYAWLFLSAPYSRMLYSLLQTFLPLAGIQVHIPDKMHIYPDTFQSFNWVTFSALFWALGFTPLKRRLVLWISGLTILSSVHLLFKLLQILFFQLKQHHLMGAINMLIVLNEWLLPFGLSIIFGRVIFISNAPPTTSPQGDFER